jgi:ketosteroid isomerase-like protein
MGRDENERVMRAYMEAWLDDDWDRAGSFYADDLRMNVPGRSPLAGSWASPGDFFQAYRHAFELLGGTIEVTGVHDLLVSDDHAVALVGERAIRGDRTLDLNRVVVYHLRDGRIAEVWVHDHDLYELDEFWT